MCSLPGLHPQDEPKSIELYALNKAIAAAVKPTDSRQAEARSKRAKTWDVHSSYHCSIIGTCLSTEELRQILSKAGEAGVRTASDHALHGIGVKLAGRKDIGSKLLNKALERKHATAIRRADRLATSDDLRGYWRDAFDKGDVAGAYWAVLGHPAADIDLMREIFGEVHMLSHLLGSAGRADMARMKRLENEIGAKADQISRQEKRLAAATARHAALQQRIDDLQTALSSERVRSRTPSGAASKGSADRALEVRFSEERARADALTEALAEAREAAREAMEQAAASRRMAESLQRENDMVEDILGRGEIPDAQARPVVRGPVLYVGGRRGLFNKLRQVATEKDVTLLLHDGGMEDSTTLLPAVVAQANMVVFPVDHISHTAMGIVKRICRESGKPFVPMRSAGLASFLAAISSAA
jgi:hypothetical protein